MSLKIKFTFTIFKRRFCISLASIMSGSRTATKVAGIGNDMALDEGVGMCGKGGQSVPAGVGQPTLLVEGLTVGGTA